MKQQKQYHAQLQTHPNVPEHPSLQLDLNYSISYRIYCPKCGGPSIKMNGPDHNHKLKLQKFKCNPCNSEFYAHTSYVIVQLAVIIVTRILSSLFSGKTPAVQLADRYNIKPSKISRLIHHCNDFVDQVIDQIQLTKQLLKERSEFDNNKEGTDIIWIDEMFFKVGRQKFALIIAIDNDYQVVGWKLSSTTNSSDIEEVLRQVDHAAPSWFILIGDGNNAYTKALKERKKDYYLIQHLHSKPNWIVSRIHKFTPEKDGSLSHVIVEVNYNVFPNLVKANNFELGYAIKKKYLPEQKAKKRGRKKGSKNRPKNKRSQKKPPKKRGPKTAKSQGNVFSISNDQGFLDVKWMDHSLQANSLRSVDDSRQEEVNRILSSCQAPDIRTIQEMLFVAFAIFQGKAIVSNLIESMNALVRNVIPVHGLKTEDHLEGHAEKLMRIHSKPVNSLIEQPLGTIFEKLPISSKLGLDNITEFFEMRIEDFEVITI